jgi:ketosteroid isomerase-like protein
MSNRIPSGLALGILVVAFSATFACNSAPATPDAAKLVEGAKKLDAQFLDAFNSRNVDAMAALYWNNSEVASFQPDTMKLHGPTEIKDYFVKGMPAMPAGAKLEILEAHYVPVGDAVMAWGLYKFTFNGSDGKSVESLGRFSDVKAERDGKWVYLMDHGSVPQMAPPAAK